jgi:hypothetical protein
VYLRICSNSRRIPESPYTRNPFFSVIAFIHGNSVYRIPRYAENPYMRHPCFCVLLLFTETPYIAFAAMRRIRIFDIRVSPYCCSSRKLRISHSQICGESVMRYPCFSVIAFIHGNSVYRIPRYAEICNAIYVFLRYCFYSRKLSIIAFATMRRIRICDIRVSPH